MDVITYSIIETIKLIRAEIRYFVAYSEKYPDQREVRAIIKSLGKELRGEFKELVERKKILKVRANGENGLDRK